MRGILAALALILGSAGAPAAESPPVSCGLSPSDWCTSPPGDRCGEHKDTESCMADPQCYGMPYRGESLVACAFDERGFAANCPTVGCVSTPPAKPGG
jgi:hypothetical protein